MIRNYLKIALRQLRNQKMYSTIKIGGFALSIAACILITLFILHELSYDRNNPDAAQVYRVVGNLRMDGNILRGPSMPAPFAKTIKADYPEVEKAGRLMSNQLFGGAGSNQIRPLGVKENTYEEGFCFADQETIDILHIPIIKGKPAAVLTEPFSLLISARKAQQLFPGQNPVGKTMIFNDNENRPSPLAVSWPIRPKTAIFNTIIISAWRVLLSGMVSRTNGCPVIMIYTRS